MKNFNPENYQIHITTSIHSNSGKPIFVARVSEIKEIYVEEKTVKKAYDQAIEEIKVYKEHYEENGLDFPPPLIEQNFSGELRVRLGKDLHKQIAIEAARNGCSLNQFIKNKLKAS